MTADDTAMFRMVRRLESPRRGIAPDVATDGDQGPSPTHFPPHPLWRMQ